MMHQLLLQVFAESQKISPSEINYSPTIKSADNAALAAVMTQVYIAAGMVAVLIIVIAGFIFVTANGDAGKIQQAKMAILGSVIGLAVIASAFVITQFVLGAIKA